VATVQAADPTAARRRAPTALSAVTYRAQRRIAALAGTVALATSVAGVGVAAARSLPGDPFYGVKRATEAVQLWTARGDEAKGKRHLEFAQTRLAEVQALSPTSSHVVSTLAAMDAETRAGSSELIAAYRSSHSTAPLTDLVVFSRHQLSGLTRLSATLPAGLRAKEASSIGLVTSVVRQVHTVAPKGLCLTCAPSSGPTPTKSPRPTKSASPQQSRHPNRHPGTSPGGHATSGPPTSSRPRRSPTPKKSLHVSIPPILPTTIPPILGHHKKHPLPTLSSLLGGLGIH
jgi:hypothetical protein